MLRRIINFFCPGRLEADLREELEYHRSRTSGTLGNVMLIQDRMRDASTFALLETVWQDLRYGLRQLIKAPIVTSVAVLSLALGIGANTAIFTLINAIMLQVLPVRDPAQLVLFNDDIFTGVYSGDSFSSDEFSYPSYQYLLAHNHSFSNLCAFRQNVDTVLMHAAGTKGGGPGEQADAHLVSGNYFETMGVNAALGRLLQSSDDTTASPRVAVISYSFWRSRFGRDRSVIGRVVLLNNVAYTIIGVAERSFFGERIQHPPDLWVPLTTEEQLLQHEAWSNRRPQWLTARDVYWLNFMGRLKPGVSLKAAEASVNLQLRQYYADQFGTHLSPEIRRKIQDVYVHLKPGAGGISGLRYLYAKPLSLLMAVVALVLLIACANVATLLLARASARRREFLARLALGASGFRLLRQVLTESFLLSAFGGIGGALFAWWCVRLLIVLLHIDSVVKVHPDARVLAFTTAISILSALVFGLAPAIKFSRMQPRPGNTPRLSRWFTTQHALIVLQIALSLILVLGAGLLIHSLVALETQNTGFRRENILLAGTDSDLANYKREQLPELYRQIQESAMRLPGVISASLVRFAPESGNVSSYQATVEGYTPPPDQRIDVNDLPIAPHFFETMGIPLLLGRPIDVRDTAKSTPVVVVNEAFVRQYSPNQNPIGRRLSLGAPFEMPGYEIVGVVGDSKYHDLREEAKPMGFFAISQRPEAGFELVLHTVGAPESAAAEVRQMLHRIDGKLPVTGITSLNVQVEDSLKQQKMITNLSAIFAGLALLLASIGIYGTLAYSVTGRVSEIGIRMAVGAQRRNVIWLILREASALIIIGMLAGLPLGLSAASWIKSFLFGVPKVDPIAIAVSVIVILMLGSLAAYLPARRAAKIDPIRALRHE